MRYSQVKACCAKYSDKSPSRTHNLLSLAADASLELSEAQRSFLDEVTAFNLQSRYPDVTNQFYERANREFASQYIEQIREFRAWLLAKIAP